MLEKVKDIIEEIKLPVVGGVVGSFIGMAIAKMIGIM